MKLCCIVEDESTSKKHVGFMKKVIIILYMS